MRALSTIGITEKNQTNVRKFKTKYKLKNADDVITIIFNVISKFKLQPELKEEADKIRKEGKQ